MESDSGCPCASRFVEPCSPQCTCAMPLMSGGCSRCCRLGSEEQRKAAARRLSESPGFPSGEHTFLCGKCLGAIGKKGGGWVCLSCGDAGRWGYPCIRPGTDCICPSKCDCQNPDRGYFSNHCPEHNDPPTVVEDCPAKLHKNGATREW